MNKRILLLALVGCFLLLMGCDHNVAIMPAEYCQLTCTDDDATGDVYGIALRSIAWNNNGDETDLKKGCYLYVDAYIGQMIENEDTWEFVDGSLYDSYTLGPEDNYGGDHPADSDNDEVYVHDIKFTETAGFPQSSTKPGLSNRDLYKLLYASQTTTALEDQNIVTKYEHKIDSCVLNKQIKVVSECYSDDNYAAVTCYKYDNGDLINGEGLSVEAPDKGDIKCPEGSGEECLDDINYEDMNPQIQEIIDTLRT